MKLSEVTFDGTLEELEDLINFLKNVQEEHTKVVKKTDICHSHFRDWSDKWNKEDSDFIVVTRFWNNNESIRQQFTSSDNITEEEIVAYTEKMAEVKKLAKYKVQDEKKDEDGNYTVSVKVEPSDVFQTLQQSSAEVSKEKIAHGMKETSWRQRCFQQNNWISKKWTASKTSEERKWNYWKEQEEKKLRELGMAEQTIYTKRNRLRKKLKNLSKIE